MRIRAKKEEFCIGITFDANDRQRNERHKTRRRLRGLYERFRIGSRACMNILTSILPSFSGCHRT